MEKKLVKINEKLSLIVDSSMVSDVIVYHKDDIVDSEPENNNQQTTVPNVNVSPTTTPVVTPVVTSSVVTPVTIPVSNPTSSVTEQPPVTSPTSTTDPVIVPIIKTDGNWVLNDPLEMVGYFIYASGKNVSDYTDFQIRLLKSWAIGIKGQDPYWDGKPLLAKQAIVKLQFAVGLTSGHMWT